MKKNVVKEKSFAFAMEIIFISRSLSAKKEFVLSNQLLRSGTSIGANIREAEHAQSKADFIHKMSIALKEANEADYWIELFLACKLLPCEELLSPNKKIKELLRLLTSIIKTSKLDIR